MAKNPSRGDSSPMLVETRKLLRKFDLRAKKGLAQHFLIDEAVLETILEAADLTPDDTVIEVGPGLGTVTRELATRAGWVIAIELDDQLAEALKTTLAPFENVVIINEDVLGTDPRKLLQGQAPDFPSVLKSYKVVANLPYYITSPVIRHFLEASVKPEVMVVMVQKEVAGVITAGPGQRSLFSNSVQFYGKPEILATVPAGSFYPSPKVDSAIVRIEVYSKPAVVVNDIDGFFHLIKAGFTANRKQIANSLAKGLGLPRDDILTILGKTNIDPRRRAETFSLEEWGNLWQVVNESGYGKKHD